ncbi:hypothetical protein [Paraburkholderia sp. CI3]|uniref:hypothetical protein n=1 Tax=Paraburkholderia sp. CI3 TaxID=2991060 RepID=UPI003D1B276A
MAFTRPPFEREGNDESPSAPSVGHPVNDRVSVQSIAQVATAETRCLADTHAAVSGRGGYSIRGERCEGELKNFVGLTDGISLIGYHSGNLSIDVQSDTPLKIEAIGDASGPVYIRALSATSAGRYQMDEEVVPLGQPIDWPTGVLRNAVKQSSNRAVDLSTLAVAACSNRCADTADTTYWPVRSLSSNTDDHHVALFVRSGVPAENVVALMKSDDGTTVTLTADGGLNADIITELRLPQETKPGKYHLIVTAFESEIHRRLSPLLATIVVPKATK